MFSKTKKRTCKDCHYLARRHWGLEAAEPLRLLPEQHKSLLDGNYAVLDECVFLCALDFWTGSRSSEGVSLTREEVDKDRSACSYFYAWQPRMGFDAARMLQERQLDNAKLETTTKIAVAAVVVTAIASVFTLLERLFEFAFTRNWIRLP